MNRRLHCLPFALLAMLILAAIALPGKPGEAQTTASTAQLATGPTYTSSDGKSSPKFPDVDLVFEVKGVDDAPIAVRAGDLKLFSQGREIGTAASIRPFAQTGYGIALILALDAGNSLNGAPLNAIYPSIGALVSQTRSQDRVAVVTLADSVQTDLPFGADPATLAAKPPTVQAGGNTVRLYDGLLDTLAIFPTAQPRRRRLLVISGGHNDGSTHSLLEVMLRARSMGVVVDAIGLTPSQDSGENLASLQQLAQETGGTFVRVQSASELEAVIRHGIEDALATPVATFHLSHLDADDKVHSLQLRWQADSQVGGQTSNLSAAAFVKTPKENGLRDFIPDRPLDLWPWALGCSFLAGVFLLALSWRGDRPQTVRGSGWGQAPATSAVASTFASPVRTPAVQVPLAPQTPTLAGDATIPRTHLAVASAKVEDALVSSADQHEKTVMERDRSQFAIFFNAPASGPFARLQINSGALAGQSIPVTTVDFCVGAAPGNDLMLPGDMTISGRHIRFVWESSTLKIEDRNSTNGTYVNAQRLAPGLHLLKPGDEIQIGRALLLVGRA